MCWLAVDYLGAVAGASGKCSSNKEALKSRSGACVPHPAPHVPSWVGMQRKWGVPPKHPCSGMQPWMGGRARAACLGWVSLCLLAPAACSSPSWHFTPLQPCSFQFNIYFSGRFLLLTSITSSPAAGCVWWCGTGSNVPSCSTLPYPSNCLG